MSGTSISSDAVARRRRRSASLPRVFLALALAGGLVAVSIVPGRSAAAAPRIVVEDGVTQPVFSYANAIRETVYVQSSVDGDDDGRLDLLATDIIRPAETEEGLRVPAIYEMSPYYQVLGRGNESEVKGEEDGDFRPEFFPLFYDNYFVPRGYAVIHQDMPGTRNSEGCMVLGGREEIVAARATMRWLNGKGTAFTGDGEEVTADWSTGDAGMIGKSYDGTIANGAASAGIVGLKTIVPIAGISRWYDYHLDRGVQYVNAYSTPELFVFVIDQTPADDEERGLQWIQATFGEAGPCTTQGIDIAAQAGDPSGDYTPFWIERDYLKDAENVTASVFVVHGLNDFNVDPKHFEQWWMALKENGVPLKIWLAQQGHVDPFDFRRGVWVRTLHRWFDRWLHGIRNGIMDEPQASIERSPGRWVQYEQWPAPDARMVPMGLRGGAENEADRLRKRFAKPGVTRSFTDDPNQTEDDMISQPRTRSAHRLAFLTRPLAEDARISGKTVIEIAASVDRDDTNLTALLVDYGNGDHWTRVAWDQSGEGIRTLEEESCHGASTEADDACYLVTDETTTRVGREMVSRGFLDAKHRQTLRQSTPLEPGKVYRFRWFVWGEDYVFAKGHRIGVIIAASDPDVTIPEENQATVTIRLQPSRVFLPVVGGTQALRFERR